MWGGSATVGRIAAVPLAEPSPVAATVRPPDFVLASPDRTPLRAVPAHAARSRTVRRAVYRISSAIRIRSRRCRQGRVKVDHGGELVAKPAGIPAFRAHDVGRRSAK